MSWIYLFIASLFEMGWPVGLKLADCSTHKLLWVLIAIIAMALSGYFLYLAQKGIPLGIAYAVWTGIGMVGTFIIGVTFFHDVISLARIFGVLLIITGVIILRICH